MQSQAAQNARARRMAIAAGFRASKSRWRADSPDNLGGFMLSDPHTNRVIAGDRYDLDAAEVMEMVAARQAA